jgi:uncharacterized protein YdaU (DUF1376 family)
LQTDPLPRLPSQGARQPFTLEGGTVPQYPYLPLFVTDYRSKTDHLTDAEHGIYLQLLMLMWQSPDCQIPDDDEWIARRFRRDVDAVRTHMRPLMREFCIVHKGWVTQKAKSKRNSASAKSRWNKDKDQSERNSERNASTHSERNAPTLPYPTISKKEDAAPNGAHFNIADDTADKQFFKRGKELLGDKSGGLLSNLLKAKSGNVALARAALETASTKENPREYIGAVVRGKDTGSFEELRARGEAW